MKKINKSMLEGPLLLSIIQYTIPIILTSILQLLFNAADMVVVGRYCGSISVAAVGATGSLTNLIITLFIGLSVGSGVSVAHAIGGREDDNVSKTVHTTIPIALICGVILSVVGIFLSENLLVMMGTPDNVLPLSSLYMKIYFGGIIFTMLYNFCASILRAAGDTKSPLIFLSVSGVLNVLLNLVFVLIFHMNVAGVALATIVSQALSAILVMIALMRRKDACKLCLSKIRIYIPQLVKIIRIGLPSGINGSLFAISNVLIQSSINSFGDVFMSGNAAASNIEGFVYVIITAFSQTSVNYIGQNHGAHQYSRIRKTFVICLSSVIVFGIISSTLAYCFAPTLLSFYITDSPEAIAYGILRMSYVCIPYFVCGLMDVTTAALRGMGASLTPMFITILGACGFRIVWIYTVFQTPEYHTPSGLFISYPISWIITFLVELVLFIFIYRKQRNANATVKKCIAL